MNFFFFHFSICFPKSQEYRLSCFGIHIADIKQSIYEVGEIKYEVQSRGIADLIWQQKIIIIPL